MTWLDKYINTATPPVRVCRHNAVLHMFIVTVVFKRNVHREFHQHFLQQTAIQGNTIIFLHSSSIDRRFTNSNWALTEQDQHSLEQCLLLMLTDSGLLATVILLTCHHHTRRVAYTILVAISSDRDVLASHMCTAIST